MTLDQIAQQIGKNIKYYDTTNGWKTGRDITEADIKEQVNYLYRDDLFPMFVTQYPWYFRSVSRANSWIANGTIDSVSSTTLTANEGIFYNGMVYPHTPLTIYNETQDDSTTITGYTGSKVITLDADKSATWVNGDDIYVLGKEFVLGGDAADLYTVEAVGVRYRTTDQFYRQAKFREKLDLYQEGWEVGSENDPEYYLTTLKVNDVPKTAIGVFNPFENKVSDALEIHYTEKPATLGDDSSPRLPTDLALVYGGTEWAYRQRGMHDEADRWAAKYVIEQSKSLSRFRPETSGRRSRVRLPRRYGAMMNQSI